MDTPYEWRPGTCKKHVVLCVFAKTMPWHSRWYSIKFFLNRWVQKEPSKQEKEMDDDPLASQDRSTMIPISGIHMPCLVQKAFTPSEKRFLNCSRCWEFRFRWLVLAVGPNSIPLAPLLQPPSLSSSAQAAFTVLDRVPPHRRAVFEEEHRKLCKERGVWRGLCFWG